ncbi:MAG: hypothetical protein D6756_03960 [Cyanobacteria bacterium J083]|nr:MAG: hypothetical protein D6756_03960 [Cyanobacteria bacterium J083]
MGHNFLLEAGRWTIKGYWLEREQASIEIKGKTIIAWNSVDWFTMITKLVWLDETGKEITFKYRGRLASNARRYSYVLQQSELGRVEGEGWICPQTIIKRYWVLSEPAAQRSGFESFRRLNENTYLLASGLFTGHYLSSTMEATLTRQV